MDSVTGASIVCIWLRPPRGAVNVFSMLPGSVWGVRAEWTLWPLSHFVWLLALRLDRWPAKSPAWPIISLGVCVFVCIFFKHFSVCSPSVQTILPLRLKMWFFFTAKSVKSLISNYLLLFKHISLQTSLFLSSCFKSVLSHMFFSCSYLPCGSPALSINQPFVRHKQ